MAPFVDRQPLSIIRAPVIQTGLSGNGRNLVLSNVQLNDRRGRNEHSLARNFNVAAASIGRR